MAPWYPPPCVVPYPRNWRPPGTYHLPSRPPFVNEDPQQDAVWEKGQIKGQKHDPNSTGSTGSLRSRISPLVLYYNLANNPHFTFYNFIALPSFSRSLHMMNASAAAQATFAVNAAHFNDCMPATAGLHVHWK